MSLDIFLSLILHMVDLTNFIFQFLKHSKGMPFGILLTGADSIRYVILIVSNKPNPILSLEFISLISPCPQSFDFHWELNQHKDTFSMSLLMDLLESSLMMLWILIEVEYRA